ncbi:MAG: hypothetical protein GX879_02640 [Bacteroidales bacterium]|nr:hypothetical protein [Bacteroidales bacterium]
MKRLSYITLMIVIVFFSCNNSSKSIVGKWNIVNITQNENDTLSDLTIPFIVFCMQKAEVNYVEFTNDGQYNLFNNENEIIETEKYSIKENLLHIEREDGIGVMEIVYKQADLIDFKNQDNSIVLSLKRIEE